MEGEDVCRAAPTSFIMSELREVGIDDDDDDDYYYYCCCCYDDDHTISYTTLVFTTGLETYEVLVLLSLF